MAFHGEVALVTGGASGMGRMSSIRLAKLGAKVFAVDMDEQGLASLSAEYPSITTQKCDVSNYDQVKELVERTRKDLGDIDRLTHAAAIMPGGTVDAMPVETFVRQMRINYEGTLYLVKTVMPDMLVRDRGDIISFGSIAGEVPLPELSGYCATKAATNSFMNQVILEHKKSNVRFLLVNPPPVNTPLLDPERTGQKGFTPKQKANALKSGVLVEPEFILDEIEKGLEKGKNIIFPGRFAKIAVGLYRFSPTLFSKLMPKA